MNTNSSTQPRITYSACQPFEANILLSDLFVLFIEDMIVTSSPRSAEFGSIWASTYRPEQAGFPLIWPKSWHSSFWSESDKSCWSRKKTTPRWETALRTKSGSRQLSVFLQEDRPWSARSWTYRSRSGPLSNDFRLTEAEYSVPREGVQSNCWKLSRDLDGWRGRGDPRQVRISCSGGETIVWDLQEPGR